MVGAGKFSVCTTSFHSPWLKRFVTLRFALSVTCLQAFLGFSGTLGYVLLMDAQNESRESTDADSTYAVQSYGGLTLSVVPWERAWQCHSHCLVLRAASVMACCKANAISAFHLFFVKVKILLQFLLVNENWY